MKIMRSASVNRPSIKNNLQVTTFIFSIQLHTAVCKGIKTTTLKHDVEAEPGLAWPGIQKQPEISQRHGLSHIKIPRKSLSTDCMERLGCGLVC